ncbi:MAG: methionine--tRNA ligase subunit beta, partial [Desulfovibrionaceae bacterium]|nr:methionine--tRNA ligase subunit beta [Desulfovibrionaceae bacterium]
YENSIVPQPRDKTDDDRAIMDMCEDSLRNYLKLFGNIQFARALEALWELVRALNKYVDTQAPWTLAKEGRQERLKTVLYVLLASMRKIALMLWPVMPHASETMLQQLGQDTTRGVCPEISLDEEITCFGGLYPGIKIAASSNIFPRIDVKAMMAILAEETRIQQEKARKLAAEKAAEMRPETTFETFKACDMRVGTVLECEKLEGADKILRFKLDFGEAQPRQILSGIAKHYDPATLVGTQVCAILNLPPRTIRGAVSNGMILTAEKDGKIVLIRPEQPVANGSQLG